MFKELAEIAPRALVAAGVVWIGVNYLFISPEVGARIARADDLPICQAHIADIASHQRDQAIAAVPKPQVNQAQERAVARLRGMQGTALGEWMTDPGLEQMFGLSSVTNGAIEDY